MKHLWIYIKQLILRFLLSNQIKGEHYRAGSMLKVDLISSNHCNFIVIKNIFDSLELLSQSIRTLGPRKTLSTLTRFCFFFVVFLTRNYIVLFFLGNVLFWQPYLEFLTIYRVHSRLIVISSFNLVYCPHKQRRSFILATLNIRIDFFGATIMQYSFEPVYALLIIFDKLHYILGNHMLTETLIQHFFKLSVAIEDLPCLTGNI